MSSLISSILLLATAYTPNIAYQVITDEFHQHNTYVYYGVILSDGPHSAAYILDLEACETKERLVFHNVVDEMIFFGDQRPPRRRSFSLQRDFDRCLLTVKKNTYRNKMHYNRDYDYWYPNYNYIDILPKKTTTRRRSKRHHKIMINHSRRSNIFIQKPKPNIQKRRNIHVQKALDKRRANKKKHKKRHHKKRGKK